MSLECDLIRCIGPHWTVVIFGHKLGWGVGSLSNMQTSHYIILINSLHHSQISDGPEIPVYIIDMHVAHCSV